MENEEKQPQGGIVNNFYGTVNNLYNGPVTFNGTYNDHCTNRSQTEDYSDKQIATALQRITGDGKALDMKQKWAGAYWYLRWACNYPTNARDFCERISTLPFDQMPSVACDLRNIRELTTLSFMDQNPCQMNKVRPNKNDEGAFRLCRSVALALEDELKNT